MKLKKLKANMAVKIILGMIIAAILTTSVFAATGIITFNTGDVSQQINDKIKDRIIEQLELKIQELLNAQDESELALKIAERINTEEILERLRQEIENQLSGMSSDLSMDAINKIIDTAIDEILESIMDEVIKVSIDDAIASLESGATFNVDEAVRALIDQEVTSQIQNIILDNVDSIIDVTIDKLFPVDSNSTETEKEEETTTPSTSNIVITDSEVSITPTSDYIGKSVATLLEDNADKIGLEYSNSTYGMWIMDINNMITGKHLAVKDGNKLVKYDYYIAFYIDGTSSNYGVSDTIIEEGKVYTFKPDSYNTYETIAEITISAPGTTPDYFTTLWGMTQSSELTSWKLDIYNSIDGSDSSNVSEVLEVLGFVATSSTTGYSAFEYNGTKVTQSATGTSGMRAFVPTVYTVNTEGKISGYAKGVTSDKSTTATATAGETTSFVFAIEWDGSTAITDVTFE